MEVEIFRKGKGEEENRRAICTRRKKEEKERPVRWGDLIGQWAGSQREGPTSQLRNKRLPPEQGPGWDKESLQANQIEEIQS